MEICGSYSFEQIRVWEGFFMAIVSNSILFWLFWERIGARCRTNDSDFYGIEGSDSSDLFLVIFSIFYSNFMYMRIRILDIS